MFSHVSRCFLLLNQNTCRWCICRAVTPKRNIKRADCAADCVAWRDQVSERLRVCFGHHVGPHAEVCGPLCVQLQHAHRLLPEEEGRGIFVVNWCCGKLWKVERKWKANWC